MEEMYLNPQQRAISAASLVGNNQSPNPPSPMKEEINEKLSQRLDRMEEVVRSPNGRDFDSDALSGTCIERERGGGQIRRRSAERAELLNGPRDEMYLDIAGILAEGDDCQPRPRGLHADGDGRVGMLPQAMREPDLSTSNTHSERIRLFPGRPIPQCWEHGCNGRQFSTFTNLLRHQREHYGSAAKGSNLMFPGTDTLATMPPAADPSRPGQSSESASNNAEQLVYKRRIMSCDHCRRRKIRCNATDTDKICSNCVRAKMECKFTRTTKLSRRVEKREKMEERASKWGLQDRDEEAFSGRIDMGEERGREIRRRSSNASMLSERLDEIGKHHSSRTGSANPSREASPFRPQSPYYCSDNGLEHGRSASPFPTVNMRDLDSKASPWMSRVEDDDPQSTMGRFDRDRDDDWNYEPPLDMFAHVTFDELEYLKRQSDKAFGKADLPAATCSPAPFVRKRKLSLSPPPIAKKVAQSRAEGSSHQAEGDGLEEKKLDASIEGISSSMGASEIPNRGGRKASNLVTCEVCNDFTGRPSDVRKHAKRHTRPYFCISAGCSQYFGSKHDWRRHHLSRHNELINTKFNLTTGGCEDSKRLFSEGENMEHLNRGGDGERTLSDETKGWDTDHACRRGYQLRFWCGFCDGVILEELKSGSGEDWEQMRFDHVGDHVEKKGKRRNGWKLPASPIVWP